MSAKPATPSPAGAKPRPKRPWRDNLEAFGVAILMAVLLKPMLIEAYQIPTSSMQPTLMGSPEAGIHDRILVDKICYEYRDPKRWDIVVFRYPIRRNQNYVKRIVGVPGDRLRVTGGNLYQVGADNQIASVIAKPARLQDGLWKEVFPLRRTLNPGGKILGDYFECLTGRAESDGDDLMIRPSSGGRVRLLYTNLGQGGLCNQIYDGYPTDVAKAIREGNLGRETQGVQDLRLSATVTPTTAPALLRLELRLTPDGKKPRSYRLDIENGVGVLVVEVGGERAGTSPPFDLEVAAGAATRVGFAHIDDRLVAYRDGDEIADLDVGAARLTEITLESRVITLAAEAHGSGPIRLADLRVERDLHYTADGLRSALVDLTPEGVDRALPNHVIEIPPDGYFMMGDNTLASADGRQWEVITLGMAADGELVNPKTHPDARVLRGNRRPWGLGDPPDPDENPVIVRGRDSESWDRIAFTDENGEVFALHGKISIAYDPKNNMELLDGLRGPTRWVPDTEHVYFVPREHILGRPLLTFWPLGRIGFIQ